MPIKDLQARQGKVDIVVEVVDKGEVREFQKFGKAGRVCNAAVKDETGEIKLTLWNEQIDQVNKGDKVRITNGYVSEFQGEKQLTTGKFGQLEVIEKAEPAEEKKEEPKEGKPEQPAEQEIEETPVEEEKIE